MKFVIDAHLPRSLAAFFADRGHSAVHVSDLENGYASSDEEIAAYADRDNAIVISKDADFVNAVRLKKQPKKLIALKTGNSSNTDLIVILTARLPEIEKLISDATIIEVHREFLVAHSEPDDPTKSGTL